MSARVLGATRPAAAAAKAPTSRSASPAQSSAAVSRRTPLPVPSRGSGFRPAVSPPRAALRRGSAARRTVAAAADVATASPAAAVPGAGRADRAQGLTLRPDGSAKLVVWAPMAGDISLQVSSEASRTWTTIPVPQEVLDNLKEWETAPEPQVLSDYTPEGQSYALSKGEGGNWAVELPPGVLQPGTPYR